MTNPVDDGRNRSETFAEFARAEGFSLSPFFKLKKWAWDPMCFVSQARALSGSPRRRARHGANAWTRWRRATPRSSKRSAAARKLLKLASSQLAARTTSVV
jgi:hypothetical protein